MGALRIPPQKQVQREQYVFWLPQKSVQGYCGYLDSEKSAAGQRKRFQEGANCLIATLILRNCYELERRMTKPYVNNDLTAPTARDSIQGCRKVLLDKKNRGMQLHSVQSDVVPNSYQSNATTPPDQTYCCQQISQRFLRYKLVGGSI